MLDCSQQRASGFPKVEKKIQGHFLWLFDKGFTSFSTLSNDSKNHHMSD